MSRRAVTATALVGWTMIILSVGHVATDLALSRKEADPNLTEAQTAMDAVQITMAGTMRTLSEIVTGYSLLMGLMTFAWGVAMVSVSRHATEAPKLIQSALWVSTLIAGAGLTLSLLYMPTPTIIGFGICALAALIGLLPARLEVPSGRGIG